jgi:hypothetical protein
MPDRHTIYVCNVYTATIFSRERSSTGSNDCFVVVVVVVVLVVVVVVLVFYPLVI